MAQASTDVFCTQILEELLQENDQAVHVYFLLAMANHAGGHDETASEYITEGEAVIERLGLSEDDPAVQGFKSLKVIALLERHVNRHCCSSLRRDIFTPKSILF